MGESQSLRLFDEIGARVAFPSERRFRHGREPLMNVHRKTLETCEHDEAIHPGATHHLARSGDIVLWGKMAEAQPRGEPQKRACRTREPYEAPSPLSPSEEGGGVSNPTRSAIDTASAND